MVQNWGDIILSGNRKIKGKPSIFYILITLSGADSLLFEPLVFRINLVTSLLHFTLLEKYCHSHQFLSA